MFSHLQKAGPLQRLGAPRISRSAGSAALPPVAPWSRHEQSLIFRVLISGHLPLQHRVSAKKNDAKPNRSAAGKRENLSKSLHSSMPLERNAQAWFDLFRYNHESMGCGTVTMSFGIKDCILSAQPLKSARSKAERTRGLGKTANLFRALAASEYYSWHS